MYGVGLNHYLVVCDLGHRGHPRSSPDSRGNPPRSGSLALLVTTLGATHGCLGGGLDGGDLAGTYDEPIIYLTWDFGATYGFASYDWNILEVCNDCFGKPRWWKNWEILDTSVCHGTMAARMVDDMTSPSLGNLFQPWSRPLSKF